MRQHLTCVQAAGEISGGVVDGAKVGSTEVVFRPGSIRGSDYHFKIGTTGSTMLLLQTLLPALLYADRPATLRLEGGTHNPMAPTFEFIERVYLPMLGRMGVEVEVSLLETGFAPAGGGVVECRIKPCEKISKMSFVERGELEYLHMRVMLRDLDPCIGKRMMKSAQKI